MDDQIWLISTSLFNRHWYSWSCYYHFICLPKNFKICDPLSIQGIYLIFVVYICDYQFYFHIYFLASFGSPQYQYTGSLLYVEMENLLLLYLLLLIFFGSAVEICVNGIYILSLLYIFLDVLLPVCYQHLYPMMSILIMPSCFQW